MRRAGSAWRIVAVAIAACALVLFEPASAAATGVVSQGPRTRPLIALTIDDGWSPATCRAVFDILERRHVPATFFPVGEAMSADRALWREIAARGYPIGDHTAQHTLLAGKPVAEQQAAIAAGAAWVKAITGRAAIPVVRPPAGEWDGNTVIAASRAGERLVLLWDTTFGDTNAHPIESSVIANATRGTNGSVVLMHCNRAISAQVLERVIDAYLARGFEFVTIPRLFGFKGPAPRYPAVVPSPTPTAFPILPADEIARRLDRAMSGEGRLPPVLPASPTAPTSLATPAPTPAATVAGAAGGTMPPYRDRPDPVALVGVCLGLLAIGALAGLSTRFEPRWLHGRGHAA